MIYVTIPFSKDKNLFDAYDQHFQLLQDDDWLVINDMDTLFTSYNWYNIIERSTQFFVDGGIFTGYTNRVACRWQVADGCPQCDNIQEHRNFGMRFSKDLTPKQMTPIDRTGESLLSGFLMVISKKFWEEIKPMIVTRQGCLGLDNELHLLCRDMRDNTDWKVYQIPIYMYHWYRGGTNDKTHLL
jgi:hypothetical protein